MERLRPQLIARLNAGGFSSQWLVQQTGIRMIPVCGWVREQGAYKDKMGIWKLPSRDRLYNFVKGA